MIVKVVIIVTALLVLLFSGAAMAGCEHIQRLAQEHSNGMARRHSLDHRGSGVVSNRCVDSRGRCARGATAENVALASSKEEAMKAWRESTQGHAEILLLPGCRGIANSGRYWTLIIGDSR